MKKKKERSAYMLYAPRYEVHITNMLNESQQKPKPRRQLHVYTSRY